MSKARQQRANVKARKAKAKAKHEAEFCAWQKRWKDRHKPRPLAHPFSGQVLSLAAMEALIGRMERDR